MAHGDPINRKYTYTLPDGEQSGVLAHRVEFISNHVVFYDYDDRMQLAVHADEVREVFLDD